MNKSKESSRLFAVNSVAMFLVFVVMATYASAEQLTAPVTVKDSSNTSTLATVTDNGRVGIGTATPSAPLHVIENSISLPRGIVSAQHNDGGHGAVVVFQKSRGTEKDPKPLVFPTDTKLGDYVGGLVAMPYNNINYERSAQLSFRIDQTPYDDPNNPGALLNPTGIIFVVGASRPTLQEAMRINSSGKVGIGTDSPNALLEVKNGGIRINTETTVTRPPCDATTRGTFWVTTGSKSDSVAVCLLKSSGSYKWRTLVSGADDEHEAGNFKHTETD